MAHRNGDERGRPATIPLSRNRNFQVLWGSQVVSEFGLSASTIAFPLLVLAITGSAGASGLVLGVIAAAHVVAGLPMGALADRWDRKKIMLGCEAAQVISGASLVAAIAWGVVTLPHIIVVAAVMGVCSALFVPAEDASLPNVVPDNQVSTAVAMNTARSYLADLLGTAAGGFLFALRRFMPFAVDVVTHALALVGLTFLRLPPKPDPETQPEPEPHLVHEMAAGLRWVWGNRSIRVVAFCAVGLNLFFAAYYIVIIVLARGRGVPPGQIGVMAAMLGVGGLLGTLVAPYLHRKLHPYVSIVSVFWILTALAPLAVFLRNGYGLGVLFAAMAFLPPTANTTIITYQLLVTPDGMRGRLASVMGVLGGVAAALGPAVGGLLVGAVSYDRAVLLCAAGLALVTVLATLSPTLRAFPGHDAGEASPVAEQPLERPLSTQSFSSESLPSERRQRDG
ncbi:MAG: major facilitator transporter [Actinobacteria bacterium]|nr:major facilitator transporter [Actinomycetota bacterium]